MEVKSLDNPVFSGNTEVISVETATSKGGYSRFDKLRSTNWNRWMRYVLAFFVFAALVLSIVSLCLPRNGESGVKKLEKQQSARAWGSGLWFSDEGGFRPIDNVYITEGIEGMPNSHVAINISDASSCHQHCLDAYGNRCGFFSFDPTTKNCASCSSDFYTTWTVAQKIDGATTYYRKNKDLWKILYRRPKLTKSGYTDEMTGPWMDDNYYTNGSLTHFDPVKPDIYVWSILKSQVTNYWEELKVQKVKVSLFKDGKEVHYLIFDGMNSNSRSWFKAPFLLETSWKDLGPGNPPMNIDWWWKQHNLEQTDRSMYVVEAHRGCNSDWMWMVVIQSQKQIPCDWERVGLSNVPRLLYAPNDTFVNTSQLAEADYLTISVSGPYD